MVVVTTTTLTIGSHCRSVDTQLHHNLASRNLHHHDDRDDWNEEYVMIMIVMIMTMR